MIEKEHGSREHHRGSEGEKIWLMGWMPGRKSYCRSPGCLQNLSGGIWEEGQSTEGGQAEHGDDAWIMEELGA